VPSNNEKAMANAIKELIKNSKMANKLSVNARDKALNFDVEKVKRQWLNILK
jgi:glycosyltransferase involved in cell wall biosynthesis